MLGLRCCGVRCTRERTVRASWRAREDLTGLVLHRDCLVDHSPRRTLAMLRSLTHQTNIHCVSPTSLAGQQPHSPSLSTNINVESCNGTEQPTSQGSQTTEAVIEPSTVVVDNNVEGADSKAVEDTTCSSQGVSVHTVSVEVHDQL